MSEDETEALRSFYVANRHMLYTYALSITRNRESAEDAIHQAFNRLVRKSSLPKNLRGYAFRCVRNAALDDLRRSRVRSASIFADTVDPDTVATHSGSPLSAGEIDAILQAVSTDERDVIVLKVYNMLTFQEIADLRNVPISTVTSWYRRGLEKIRGCMEKEEQ